MPALSRLRQYFHDRPPVAVAVSGGVDSMTLAVIAHRTRPDTQVFHAVSPAVPGEATARVKRRAATEGWRLSIIDAGEMNDPRYLANPANRCYFCKTNLYHRIAEQTSLQVASGANLDDLGDYRPGLIAAAEHRVCHPYVELGLGKPALRAVAGALGLDDVKDLPASPCLSSRVTTGIAIDAALLPVIDRVEAGLWRLLTPHLTVLGLRCRIRDGEVALQVQTPDVLAADAGYFREALAFVKRTFVAAGFPERVGRIVIEPYRKGSAFLVDTLEVS